MSGFLSGLGGEFMARRRRLRRAVGDRRASLIEFALLAGVMLGAVSPGFGPSNFPPYGPALPALAVLGYLLLEAGRQRALAGGADEAALRPAFDRRALLFVGAVAAIGYATFVWATLAPPPFELVPEEAPADALAVTIGP